MTYWQKENPVISDAELNRLHGDIGHTFSTREQAEQFAVGKKGATIYPLYDGVGVMRHQVGFLVHILPPPKPKGKFTGKVRGGMTREEELAKIEAFIRKRGVTPCPPVGSKELVERGKAMDAEALERAGYAFGGRI